MLAVLEERTRHLEAVAAGSEIPERPLAPLPVAPEAPPDEAERLALLSLRERTGTALARAQRRRGSGELAAGQAYATAGVDRGEVTARSL